MTQSQWFHTSKVDFSCPPHAHCKLEASAPRGPACQSSIYQEHNQSWGTGERDHCGGHTGAKSFPLEMTQVTCIHFISQISSYGQV